MAEVTKLTLSVREKVGTNASRALRKLGRIPVNLYGHGQDTASLSADGKQMNEALDRQAQFLELAVGQTVDTALIREVQYDTYGLKVLHVEFERVNVDEPVVISVPIALRGQAKGLSDGGVLERFLDRVQIRVAPRYMPEQFELSVGALELHESILLKDLELPSEAELVDDPEKRICTVVAKKEELEESGDEEAADGEEPEVMGAKQPDEDSPA